MNGGYDDGGIGGWDCGGGGSGGDEDGSGGNGMIDECLDSLSCLIVCLSVFKSFPTELIVVVAVVAVFGGGLGGGYCGLGDSTNVCVVVVVCGVSSLSDLDRPVLLLLVVLLCLCWWY